MTLQAEEDIFVRLIAGVNAVPLAEGFDRIYGKSELFCNRSDCLLLLICHRIPPDEASHIKIEGQRKIPAPHADHAFTSVPL